jgi:hypothetical protein
MNITKSEIDSRSAASCTLSINICVTDLPYISYTIPHLVRSCNYPFTERMLVIDTAPMKGRYRNQVLPDLGELETAAEKLVAQGHMDTIIKVDYRPEVRQPIVRKHLGQVTWETHDFRDAPIYAYLFAYEMAQSDYFLHFDADMLLHQAKEYNWIEAAIDCLRQNPDVLTVTPLPGPPTPNLELKQREIRYTSDPRGFFTFKEFTARRYLFDRRRLDSILPLPLSYISWKRHLVSHLTRKSAMERWEGMMTHYLQTSPYIRADLATPQAWTLHGIDHGTRFLELLPHIITRIEQGEYPVKQAGDYDLQLDAWQS